MEIRCYICDNDFRVKYTKDNKPICLKCRQEIFSLVPRGKTLDVRGMVKELEDRIPGLMNGPICPGDCACNCTNKTGCLLLTREPIHDKVEGREKKRIVVSVQ